MKNIVDSSGWLEYLADSKNAKNFAKAIEDVKKLIVPVITIYEVFKKVILEKDESTALKVIAHMKQGEVIDLNLQLSLLAVQYGKQYKLPMADSIIYATAMLTESYIWTQDSDFKGLDAVKYFTKQ